MKAYFDRTEPYYLSRVPTFDGQPVEVDEKVLEVLESRKATLAQVEVLIDEVSLDEASQDVADAFVAMLLQEESLG